MINEFEYTLLLNLKQNKIAQEEEFQFLTQIWIQAAHESHDMSKLS